MCVVLWLLLCASSSFLVIVTTLRFVLFMELLYWLTVVDLWRVSAPLIKGHASQLTSCSWRAVRRRDCGNVPLRVHDACCNTDRFSFLHQHRNTMNCDSSAEVQTNGDFFLPPQSNRSLYTPPHSEYSESHVSHHSSVPFAWWHLHLTPVANQSAAPLINHLCNVLICIWVMALVLKQSFCAKRFDVFAALMLTWQVLVESSQMFPWRWVSLTDPSGWTRTPKSTTSFRERRKMLNSHSWQ